MKAWTIKKKKDEKMFGKWRIKWKEVGNYLGRGWYMKLEVYVIISLLRRLLRRSYVTCWSTYLYRVKRPNLDHCSGKNFSVFESKIFLNLSDWYLRDLLIKTVLLWSKLFGLNNNTMKLFQTTFNQLLTIMFNLLWIIILARQRIH